MLTCVLHCILQENLNQELAERDWGVQQVLTSANWGGVVGNFFTGGLNLQVREATINNAWFRAQALAAPVANLLVFS